jgi:O-antigen/teichoic acid export membrane protein
VKGLARLRRFRAIPSRGGEGEAAAGIGAGVAVVLAGNATAAALGFVQSIVVVRALGVVDYGLYGILASAAAICSNLFDFRLGDATMRRFFASPAKGGEGSDPLAAILAGAIAQVALAILLAGAIAVACLAVLPAFPGLALGLSAILAFAASEAVASLVRYLLFTLRLARRPRELARWEVRAVAARAVAIVAAVVFRPSISGLVAGLLLGNLFGLTIAAAGFRRLWVREERLRTTPAALRHELGALAARRRELFALNAINYQNLFHRGADVLSVGLLVGPSEAGLYKLARAATDALYVFYDAAAKTLQPVFMQALAAGAAERMASFARRAVVLSALAVALVIALELMLLPLVLRTVLGESFGAALPAIAWLTVPVFFAFGLQLWAWPLVVTKGEVRAYAASAFAAVMLGQYALGLGGFLLGLGGSASWFAFVYATSEALLWASFGPRAARLLAADDAETVAPARVLTQDARAAGGRR